ncbi:helix-turn-helix domain-containing protein [Maribellus maritimus]|uniref:helix-turn-helix domain-containing protein n=1 Tax=Maribellus maritimus TaxID=2870838 RepID=UPI001EEA167D|nr:helix-turn-helix domain-containing protein [Maribellus maritimus]MCG6187257.1 helix-turn-helix domain-containing protein [Maribellus maritimus]
MNWKHLLHALPIFIIGIQRSLGNQVSMNSSSDLSENPSYIYNNIYYALLIISVVTYWILSIQLILRHRKNIPYFFSNYTAKNTLNWLILLIVVFLFLIVIELFISYIEKLMNTKFTELSSIHINLTIFTFMLVFFGIKQTAIYKKQKVSLTESGGSSNLSDSLKTKNTQAALNEKQEKDLNKEIIQYLKTKKPYTNPDYSLQMMVEDLNVPRYKISQVINASQKKNFFKFINEFRVEEVKEKLANPSYKNYTLLGIALECGFNSKTSFNRIFKEETGVTPSHYKKSL